MVLSGPGSPGELSRVSRGFNHSRAIFLMSCQVNIGENIGLFLITLQIGDG